MARYSSSIPRALRLAATTGVADAESCSCSHGSCVHDGRVALSTNHQRIVARRSCEHRGVKRLESSPLTSAAVAAYNQLTIVKPLKTDTLILSHTQRGKPTGRAVRSQNCVFERFLPFSRSFSSSVVSVLAPETTQRESTERNCHYLPNTILTLSST